MDRLIRGARRALVSALAATAWGSAPAAPSPDVPVDGLLGQLEASFDARLPPGSRARESLREVARAQRSLIAERFAQRLRAAKLPKQKLEPVELQLRVSAWMTNQFALATANAGAHEKVGYFEALMGGAPTAAGQSCNEEIVARQSKPLSDQRSLAVASFLRVTIERIGLEDRVLAPPKSDFDTLMSALAIQSIARPDGDEPLPPSVQRLLRATGGAPDAKRAEEAGCELQKWLLRRAARDPSRYRTELDALAYDVAASTHDQLAQLLPADTADSSDYPGVARLFGIEGLTEVEVELDAENRPENVTILRRDIKVPGLLGEPPLAFERVFDAKTIEHASQRTYPPRPAGRQTWNVRYEIEWQLPATTPAPR